MLGKVFISSIVKENIIIDNKNLDIISIDIINVSGASLILNDNIEKAGRINDKFNFLPATGLPYINEFFKINFSTNNISNKIIVLITRLKSC